MSTIASVAQHGYLWTPAQDAELRAWVQDTRAQLSPNARGIPQKNGQRLQLQSVSQLLHASREPAGKNC